MDEIEHNRLAKQAADIQQAQQYYETKWDKWNTTHSTSTASTGDTHLCNCIGCCLKCGMCRTHPRHTPDVCQNLVQHDIYRQHIIYDD